MSEAKQAVHDQGTQYEAERAKFAAFKKALTGAADGIPGLSIFLTENREYIELVFHGVPHRVVHYFVEGDGRKGLSIARMEAQEQGIPDGYSIQHHLQFVFDTTGAVQLGGTNGQTGLTIPNDAHEVLYYLLSGIKPKS